MIKVGLAALVSGVLSFIIYCVTVFTLHVLYDRNCGGHLERAAHANTVKLAAEELKVALDYMEKHDLTSGYTSVIYRTPDEDLGFTYKNVKDGAIEMEKVKDSTTLEQTNALMKLRESLLVHKGESTQLNVPNGTSKYPCNGLFMFWGWASLILIIVGVILIKVSDD